MTSKWATRWGLSTNQLGNIRELRGGLIKHSSKLTWLAMEHHLIFNREYIFIRGPFSIVLLVYQRVKLWLGFVFVCCFFTDCTMVNHHQTTIWENIFGAFSKHLNQIQVVNPAFLGNSCPFPFVGGLFSGKIFIFFSGCPRSLLMWWYREVFQSYLKLSKR